MTPPIAARPRPSPGHDFATQADKFFRLAACGGPVTEPVSKHCQEMREHYARYRRRWAERASRFIAAERPADVPSTVVYPFGGGDLVSALVAFPDARYITTISLEAAGDPRTIDTLSERALKRELRIVGHKYRRLLRSAHSTTKSLQIASHGKLAGTLMYAFGALAIHDMEPVSLRYFDIEADGSIHYLDDTDLDARQATPSSSSDKKYKTRQYWREQVSAFANVELTFRPRTGTDQPGAVRVYRHILANLDDPHLQDDSRVLVHLRSLGQVSVMTKAASYLLWLDEFSLIRQYILDHAAWMISDSSGVPPSYAGAAGFEQIPYGEFTAPFFRRDPNKISKQMIALWRDAPRRRLPFRFGYPDGHGKNHLMLMRKARDERRSPGR